MQPKIIEVTIPPKYIDDRSYIDTRVGKKLRTKRPYFFQIKKKSLDARKRPPLFRLQIEVSDREIKDPKVDLSFSKIIKGKTAHIIGAGPAGYFAALKLLKLGVTPIVYDRGKDVRARRRDLKAIQQDGIVNPHSNYCFGEGGAGTYSDGKLYTRSHKRGNIQEILELLVMHGAKDEILIDAHPHIGSNKLPEIITNIRQTILDHGGQVHFDSYMTNLVIRNGEIESFIINEQQEIKTSALILATGHSARDIYELLYKHQITIEAKSFALGVRIEHPQPLIDEIQYGLSKRGPHLPAASYRLACQVENRGVFSFCMCPGGLIVPAATAPGEIVVNGMSLSRRDSPYANSGIVVEIPTVGEVRSDPFQSLDFQKDVEQFLFENGDGSQKAPAQRMTDFVFENLSRSINDTSYIPGLYSAPLHELLPPEIVSPIQSALKQFGKRMKGYFTSEANIVGVESRTSAPVKIPRLADTGMHIDIKGLFPCGEGAGYAGGIVSAALDGQKIAEYVSQYLSE